VIVSDTCRAAAVGCLAVTIILGDLRFWLPAAVAAQQGRSATASLAGPPLGGALFGISRGIPFLADAASYVFSVVSLILMRTPFQETRQAGPATMRSQLSEGFRFLWGQPFLRTTTFLCGLTNFIGPGVLRPSS
jgi:hypothetical protein